MKPCSGIRGLVIVHRVLSSPLLWISQIFSIVAAWRQALPLGGQEGTSSPVSEEGHGGLHHVGSPCLGE